MHQAFDRAAPPTFTIRLLTGVALLAVVAGCQPSATGEAATRQTPPGAQLIDQDVEAPEVFDVTDRALWDGRPSLGGVWIAAPDVLQPERVIIRNPDNGKFVVGALFKRERGNPGPPLQLSSEAADALGVIAGAPTELSVVALRREEQPEPVVPVAEPDVPEPEPKAVAEAPAPAETPEQDEASAVAAAALDSLADGTTLVPEGGGIAPPAAEAAAPKGGFFRRLFSGDKRASEQTDETLDATDDTAATIDEPGVTAAAAPAITASSLDAPADAPVQAPAADAQPDIIAADGVTVREPKPQGTRLAKPYVEIGVFDDVDGANATAQSLAAAGILATVREQPQAEGSSWRVFVGPTLTRRDRTAVLRKARQVGFDDAKPVEG
ncbi:MAG: SPOR domain-containing protein [Pseudomonadota bacterium]